MSDGLDRWESGKRSCSAPWNFVPFLSSHDSKSGRALLILSECYNTFDPVADSRQTVLASPTHASIINATSSKNESKEPVAPKRNNNFSATRDHFVLLEPIPSSIPRSHDVESPLTGDCLDTFRSAFEFS